MVVSFLFFVWCTSTSICARPLLQAIIKSSLCQRGLYSRFAGESGHVQVVVGVWGRGSEGGVHGGSGSAGSERGSRWAVKMASLATHRAPTILLERPCGANLGRETLTGRIFFQGGPADFGGKIHFIKSGSLRIRRRVIPPNGGRGIGFWWGNPRVSTGKWHFEMCCLASCDHQKRGFAIISPSIKLPGL